MGLDLDQQLRLERIVEGVDRNMNRCTAWEVQFIVDHSMRYDEHGPEMRISPKQWAVLRRIEEKVL